MRRISLVCSVLALSLSISTPVWAHAGHGDEFQAEGGVNRVAIKAKTDALLGIQVSTIEAAADGSGTVFIPVTALVEDNGRQLVFVKYENFYEPVDVTTGKTQGELIEITKGLSVGEQFVSSGSLSLYAESRKTKKDAAADQVEETAATTQADTTGTDAAPDNAVTSDSSAAASPTPETTAASGIPKSLLALIGGGVGLAVGAIALTRSTRNKASASTDASEQKSA